MQSTFDSFLTAHDHYLRVMDHAYATGATEDLESMLDGAYNGLYASAGMEQATPFDYAAALEGMKQSISAMPGVRTLWLNRTIQLRSDSEAVASYFKRLVHNGEFRAFAFVLETWFKRPEGWRLVREIVEVGHPGD